MRCRVVQTRVLIVGLVLSMVACSSPHPILRSNAKVLLQGREASNLDVDVCQQKAEAAGLQPGTGSRSGNMAAGAALGVVAGAAVGASTGLIGGPTGVAIGAAAGGGLGLIIGIVGGAYNLLSPIRPMRIWWCDASLKRGTTSQDGSSSQRADHSCVSDNGSSALCLKARPFSGVGSVITP